MKKAFTLVELLLVIGLSALILALSITITIPPSSPKVDTLFEQFYHRARMEALTRHSEVALGFYGDSNAKDFLSKIRLFVKNEQEQWESIATTTLPSPWKLSVTDSSQGDGFSPGNMALILDSGLNPWISWTFNASATPQHPNALISLENSPHIIKYRITSEGALIKTP